MIVLTLKHLKSSFQEMCLTWRTCLFDSLNLMFCMLSVLLFIHLSWQKTEHFVREFSPFHHSGVGNKHEYRNSASTCSLLIPAHLKVTATIIMCLQSTWTDWPLYQQAGGLMGSITPTWSQSIKQTVLGGLQLFVGKIISFQICSFTPSVTQSRKMFFWSV